MRENIPGDFALLTKIFDAIPSFVLLVDEDVRLQEFNKAAAGLFETSEKNLLLQKRGGEALHCLHSHEAPKGCGHAPYCKNCVIRNSVNEAFAGSAIIRRHTRMELVRDNKTLDIHALITASPLTHNDKKFVLLIIEDISEITELQALIPICCKCKKIRNDKNFWTQIDTYLEKHLSLDFTHTYCPECLKKEMDLIDKMPQSDELKST
jgi:hypothetical protein